MENLFKEEFSLNLESKTDESRVGVFGNVRLSVLADRLLRAEISKNGVFEDKPTQKVWYRNFEDTECSFNQKGNKVIVKTPQAEFCFDLSSKKMKYVVLSDGRKVTDFNKGNLKGTYRTLDGTVGKIPLGKGLVSRGGVSVFDDSKSLTLEKDGRISARENSEKDLYFFAYGNDYRGCIFDFYRMTAKLLLFPAGAWATGGAAIRPILRRNTLPL